MKMRWMGRADDPRDIPICMLHTARNAFRGCDHKGIWTYSQPFRIRQVDAVAV